MAGTNERTLWLREGAYWAAQGGGNRFRTRPELDRPHLSWAILSEVILTMAWILSSLLASSFFFMALVLLQKEINFRGESCV